ncbi:hypothetical protein PYCCODRAFT_1480843 [Trametes coccinea BRFM310]|uniref:F-box domain-containing protein n=1 Tax=Trametes coccinea (strain BRFM310) TaxID=1353009 RepID=A0A1Y2IAE7_TRAC3|nr:hypothetical protein PYCCODRAFT_1480843 [Trametes coccinea BRFM310]
MLEGLPEELLVEILDRLELKYLLRCRLVCRYLRAIIEKSIQLQYHIELEADGLVDGIGCPLTIAERYALLLQRRKRWRLLRWSHIVPISAPGRCQAYELVDGVFASSAASEFVASPHLSFTWLPTEREPARTIERADVGLAVRDFAIDPSQDLMAIVVADSEADDLSNPGLLIILRTMSENKPHPLAASTELRALVPFELGTSFIQIADDVIGVFFWVHGPGLIIFNWRTGKTVVRVTDLRLPLGVYDFAFLSSRAYMITVASGQGTIEIYRFSGDVDVAASSQGGSPSTIADSPLPTRVAVLSLPAVKPGQAVQRFSTHSSPFVARRTPGRPFETAPDCKIHVMELSYGDQHIRFHLFVQHRYLLSYIPPEVGSGAIYEPVRKPWAEWGPDHTRFMPLMGRFEWLRYVHGERVILPSLPLLHVPGTATPPCLMMMLDFNVHPKRVDDPVSYEDDTGTTSNIIHSDGYRDAFPFYDRVFEEPIVSRLPFVRRIRERPGLGFQREYSGYMMDHEHLIGMRSSGDVGENVQLDVYTF